jgi:hypothetical protein
VMLICTCRRLQHLLHSPKPAVLASSHVIATFSTPSPPVSYHAASTSLRFPIQLPTLLLTECLPPSASLLCPLPLVASPCGANGPRPQSSALLVATTPRCFCTRDPGPFYLLMNFHRRLYRRHSGITPTFPSSWTLCLSRMMILRLFAPNSLCMRQPLQAMH